MPSAEEVPDVNPNTEWLSFKGGFVFYTVYVALLVFVRYLFLLLELNHVFGLSPARSWTVLHGLHTVVTFFAFHWVRGSPVYGLQGKYDRLTWWEQVDAQKQGTVNRKFLTLIPIVLYVLVHSSLGKDDKTLIYSNIVFALAGILPKLPMFHRVRLFGLNAGPKKGE